MEFLALIIAAMKAKYDKRGFTDKFLESLANNLAKKITKAEEIDEAVAELDDFLTATKKESDRKLDLQKKEFEKKPAPKKEETDEDADEEIPVGATAFEKMMLKQNKILLERLAKLESGKTVESQEARLIASLEKAPAIAKNLALRAFKKAKLETEDDFEAFMAETLADVAEFEKEQKTEGMDRSHVPPSPGADTPDAVIAGEVKAWADARKPKVAAAV